MHSKSLAVSTVPVDQLDRHGDAITRMYSRELAAVVVGRCFEPARLERLAAALRDGLEGMPRAVASTFKGGLFGRPLVMSSKELGGYLDDAERFRDSVAPFFGGRDELERTIETVLGRAAGGRPVSVARTEDGRRYLPASIRVLIPGDSLPIHYENGTLEHASMMQLRQELDVETIMSFYVPVQLPEAGGVLEVFSTDCSGSNDKIVEELGGNAAARDVLASRGYVEIRPAVGDMLIFDGGRYYHHVTEVRGAARWTMGGFFAFSRAHDRVVYWS